MSGIDLQAEDVTADTILRAYPDHSVPGEERGAMGVDAEVQPGGRSTERHHMRSEDEEFTISRGSRALFTAAAAIPWTAPPTSCTSSCTSARPARSPGTALLHGMVAD